MIDVTELAQSMIRETIANESDLGNLIRVVARKVAPHRFEYDIYFIEADEIAEGDTQQPLDELVFIADAESVEHLDGATIDYVVGPPGGFKFDNPRTKRHFDTPLETELNDFIEEAVNPRIAAHRGHISLHGIRDNKVYLEMGGSCQGCGMAAMTLRNGVEKQILERYPDFAEIVDVTNHDEGKNPFYAKT